MLNPFRRETGTMPGMNLPIGVGPIGRGSAALVVLAGACLGVVNFIARAAEIGDELVGNQSGQADGQSALTTNSLLEQFKAFISSPPPISNLVFQVKVPMDGGARPRDGSFARSTRFEYFQAGWQTNGLLFRRLSGPSEMTNLDVPGELVSWSGHRHAVVEPNRQLTAWDDRDPSIPTKPISIFYASQSLQQPLREVLNLGIMFAGIGAVRWEGNRFRTEVEVDPQHLLITGEIVPSADGLPRAMRVCYAFPHLTNWYVVRYGYAPGQKRFMPPTAITNFWVTKDEKGADAEMELDEWRILNFERGEAPLGPEAFDVEAFARQNNWLSRVYTNGAIYDPSTNGVLRLAYSLGDFPTRASPASQTVRTVFYGCWGGMNIAIFALMAGAKEWKKQPNEDERKSAP